MFCCYNNFASCNFTNYVGLVSANNNKNKLEKCGWTIEKSTFINAPIIQELPLVLECKLISYDSQTEICIGEVVNVSVKESILNEQGKIDLTRFNPICYDCDGHGYYVLGEKVGQAFTDGLKLKNS